MSPQRPASVPTDPGRAPARRSPRRRLGDGAEALVAKRLTALGWTVLGAGVIVGRDELDLVAVEPGAPATLVFVEVRSHRTDRFGPPEATVDEPKLRRVYRAGLALAAAGVLPDGRSLPAGPWRVDLVAVDLHPAIGRAAGGPTMRHLRSVIPR